MKWRQSVKFSNFFFRLKIWFPPGEKKNFQPPLQIVFSPGIFKTYLPLPRLASGENIFRWYNFIPSWIYWTFFSNSYHVQKFGLIFQSFWNWKIWAKHKFVKICGFTKRTHLKSSSTTKDVEHLTCWNFSSFYHDEILAYIRLSSETKSSQGLTSWNFSPCWKSPYIHLYLYIDLYRLVLD